MYRKEAPDCNAAMVTQRLKDGHILAHGTPADTLTADNLKLVF